MLQQPRKQFETTCHLGENLGKQGWRKLKSQAETPDGRIRNPTLARYLVHFDKRALKMKTQTQQIIVLALSLSFATAAWSAGPHRNKAVRPNCATVTGSLDTVEAANLTFMREEEKLARDVYRLMYQVWKIPAFRNIAGSEQRHMDALLRKITGYQLTDPVQPSAGVFTNTDLQTLYDTLTAKGNESSVDALLVGAAIEDKDIRDIAAAIAETDELALKMTYSNLLEGSKNHLRAFVRLLSREGVSYEPQFISQAEFDAIIGL